MSSSRNATPRVVRIVSGGQTGVDRAALDLAIELGLEHGGWCPQGRLAEDGVIPTRYALREMESSDYAVRTEQNVIDSDGTLIIYSGRLQRGSLLTYRLALKHAKPVWRARLDSSTLRAEQVQDWLSENSIQTLNVAGPRASSNPVIGQQAAEFLRNVLMNPPSKLF